MSKKDKKYRSEFQKKVIDAYYTNGFNNIKAMCIAKDIEEPKDSKTREQLSTRCSIIKGENAEYMAEIEAKNEKKFGNMRDKLVNKLDEVAGTYEQLVELALQDSLSREDEDKFRRLRSIMSTKDYNKAVELIGKLTGSFEPVKKEVTNNYTVSFGDAPQLKNNTENIEEADYTKIDD
jgi:hypothetical protein